MELLVVIAIIGLIATLSVIAFGNARAKSRDSKRVSDIKQLQTALELFFSDQGRYPTAEEWNTGSLYATGTYGATTYMARIPTPPSGCVNFSDYYYSSSYDGQDYVISSCLENTTGSLARGVIFSGPMGLSTSYKMTCRDGYVWVPGDASLNTLPGFCMMKYEAKLDSGIITNSSCTGNESSPLTTAILKSVGAGLPVTLLNVCSAKAACINSGAKLTSREQWLTMARNVETVSWNWSGGTVGSGTISNGHGDCSPYAPIEGSIDSDPCYLTGQTCDINTWNSQRRTLKLTNGEYIWDTGGNAPEQLSSYNENNSPVDFTGLSGTYICTSNSCGNLYNSNDNWYPTTTLRRWFVYGNSWCNADAVGTFSMAWAATNLSVNTSIRCSY